MLYISVFFFAVADSNHGMRAAEREKTCVFKLYTHPNAELAETFMETHGNCHGQLSQCSINAHHPELESEQAKRPLAASQQTLAGMANKLPSDVEKAT